MKKRFLSTVGPAIIGLAYVVVAVQPNYVETTTSDVDGSGSNVVSTEYADGLGRGIQSKLKLDGSKDRISCTFYDEAGRPEYTTKPFVDIQKPGVFLPGELTDDAIKNQLEKCYKLENSEQYDTRAFTQTEYWDDPLGRARKVVAPGVNNTGIYTRTWTFGMNSTENYSATTGNTTFSGGMIVSFNFMDGTSAENIFDQLYAEFINLNPFTAPDHFLSVTLEPEGKISEQLTDIFGRTVKTYTDPNINSKSGFKIASAYCHDILGNVLEEIPLKAGNVVLIGNSQYRYNTLGQLIWKKYPDIDGELNYVYLDNGALDSVKFASGSNLVHALKYTYDDLGRQTGIIETIPPDITRLTVVQNYYDNIDAIPADLFNRLSPNLQSRFENCKGRLICSVRINYLDDVIKVINFYSYDDDGRVRFKATYIDGTPTVQETWYEYDLHGKVSADFCFFGSNLVKKLYKYDHLGRLLKVVHDQMDGDTLVLSNYAYNDLGDLVSKNYEQIGSNYEVGYKRDILDRLTAITTPTNFKGFNEAIASYSKTGNILTANYDYEFNPGSTDPYSEHHKQYGLTYHYDTLSRVTTVASSLETNDFVARYTYDQVGRFKEKIEGKSKLTDYGYYGTSSRLRKTNNTDNTHHEYIFDTRGNLIVDFTKNMIINYDWRNLPFEYRFYSDLNKAEITKNIQSGTLRNWSLISKVINGEIQIVAKVFMIYDADGNRVCKMDVKN
jgi:hypothetical protein